MNPSRSVLTTRVLSGAIATAVAVTWTLMTGVGSAPAATPEAPASPSAASGPISKACLAPAAPSSGHTQFGVSLSPSPMLSDDLKTEQARFGHLRVVRTWDTGMPPSNAWDIRAPQLKRRTLVTSIKVSPVTVLSGSLDAEFRHYFRTAPRKPTIYWSFFHEPEQEIQSGEFTALQYRQAWRHIGRIAAEFCRPNLHPALILTGWTADPQAVGSWRDYYPGKNYISVVAWDPYNQAVGTPRSYLKPADVFRAVVRASRKSGKPWGIAETGTARTTNDRSGTGRAKWIGQMGRYLKNRDALFVLYFQSTKDGDFELRDAPSIKAYRALVLS